MLAEKLKKMITLPELAISKGAVRAELILADKLAVEERVRMKCRLNECGNYTRNLMCPPHVPDLAENGRMLKGYTFALVTQVTCKLPEDEYLKIYPQFKERFGILMVELEKEAFRLGFPLALALSGGNCTICDSCAALEGLTLCRFPGQARPSMEALGMDVGAVCRAVSFPSDFVPGEITLTGLLLID